jgi:class 3 adenylate cyclase
MGAENIVNIRSGPFKWLNLPFKDKSLEDAFVNYYVQDSLKTSQILMLISAFAFYISFMSDRVIDPELSSIAHLIRGLIAMPVMIICAFCLSFKYFQKYYEIIAVIFFLIPQISLCIIFINLDKGFEYSALSFIILLMGVNLTFTVRLKYTIIISLFGISSLLFSQLYAENAANGWLILNRNYAITAIIFSSISAHMRERAARRRFLTQRAIVESQAQVDDLLQSLLPISIAERIQAGETTIADSHGEVTVIFARITGIKDPGNSIQPIQRVRGLNRLFSIFDAESERYGIEKIKTIGGCYMAIAGLSVKPTDHDHAENAANFAIAIRSIVQKWNSTFGVSISFGIGIHVGPIVAGVIGQQRPRFDCWGDTVNIASRLESFASASKIYVSESTFWRLKPKFDMLHVGEYSMKGIGETTIYQLENRNKSGKISFNQKTIISEITPA